MRALASVRLRLFLIAWIVFGVHFATNVVREHYPAFALIERGDFFLDDYAGFHADIYFHPVTRHWVVGNQVLGSLPAVLPLLVFDPALDALQNWELAHWAQRAQDAEYATDRPNRAAFFRAVRDRGLLLRFGASAALTSLLLMAPFGAGLVALMHRVLEQRGVSPRRAAALALLFGLGTPVFYRSAHLVHNMFLLGAVFGASLLLWRAPGDAAPQASRRVFWAGVLAGSCLALDYAGAIALAALGLYLALPRWREAGFARALRESLPFVAGVLPPLLFLLATQAWMYGDPFTPGQMHQQENEFTARGVRGIDWPSLDVFARNLFDDAWGLIPWTPFLALAFLPSRWLGGDPARWILPRRERRFVAAFAWAFLLFCAMNQFSLLQWNTGFRYLLPLVPLWFLAAADWLGRMPRPAFAVIAAASIAHMWVLSMSRFQQPSSGYTGEAVPLACWREILTHGPQLPWLTVLRQTVSDPASPIHWTALPSLILVAAFAVCAWIWRAGEREAARSER
ncbi:MAG: hypothetical protein ACHQ6V_14610 [Myxococcota bacterium]